MKTFLGLFVHTIMTTCLLSQTVVTGSIVDDQDEAISFANVLVLNSLDSTLIKGDLCDGDGNFRMSVDSDKSFIIAVNFIGYNDFYSELLSPDSETHNLGSIRLSEGVELQEVEIIAKKPLYEQKIDRLVINVANSVTSAGGTALEVLERSPGVVVNRQSNTISLVGKDGVNILINGKPSYQPAESIVQMLEGMSADNIENIELITTPPANFDAEGNAGFINIVLRSKRDQGLQGNISLTAGLGNGYTNNDNVNLNYRNNNLNIYGSYSFLLRTQGQEFFNSRKVNFSQVTTESQVLTDRDPVRRNHNYRIGLDYKLNDKTTLGFLTSGYDNKWTMDSQNEGFTLQNQIRSSEISLATDELNYWKHRMVNLNLEHQITSSSKVNLNFDLLNYDIENPTDYETDYLDGSSVFLYSEETRSNKDTPIDIRVGQVDYEFNLNNDAKLEAGLKMANSTFDNIVSVETLEQEDWILNDQFTNESNLDETITAAYSNYNFKLGVKSSFKVGLRYEHTDTELITVKEGVVVDRNYGNLFPSIFYGYTLNEDQSFNLSYSRRITRPTYNEMAPFAIFLDPNTYFFGNAALQPAISDNYKVDYRYKSYMLSIQYAKEDSTIARFQDRVDLETNQQAFEPVNLSGSESLSATLSVPLYIGNSWTMQNNFTLMRSSVKSYYDAILVEQSITSYNFNLSQNIKLTNSINFEANGFYRSRAIFGRSQIDAFYGVNAGIQKKFTNGSSLSFNVNDIFESVVFKGGTNIPETGFVTTGSWDFSNRTFQLTYRTSFGNKEVKASRNRITGSEEERNRAQ